MKKLALAAAALAVGTVSASAADLAARPYTKAPVAVAAVYNWTGFYIGAHVGYGWGDNRTTEFVTATGSARLVSIRTYNTGWRRWRRARRLQLAVRSVCVRSRRRRCRRRYQGRTIRLATYRYGTGLSAAAIRPRSVAGSVWPSTTRWSTCTGGAAFADDRTLPTSAANTRRSRASPSTRTGWTVGRRLSKYGFTHNLVGPSRVSLHRFRQLP